MSRWGSKNGAGTRREGRGEGEKGRGGERRGGEGGGGRREGEEKEEEGGGEGSSLFGKRAVYPPSNPFTILSELSHENHNVTRS